MTARNARLSTKLLARALAVLGANAVVTVAGRYAYERFSHDSAAAGAEDEAAALPQIRFQDGSGESHTLAEFRGRVVLLNVWAT